MLLLLAVACLTNEDLYDQRRALLTDQDGDGVTEAQGDCDDNDANRLPGAPERNNTRTVTAPTPRPSPVRAPTTATSTPWATAMPPPFTPRSHHQRAQSAPHP